LLLAADCAERFPAGAPTSFADAATPADAASATDAIDAPDAPDASDAPGTICSSTSSPGSPIEYGENELSQALTKANSTAHACITTIATPEGESAIRASGITLDARPESYAILPLPNADTLIVGRDEVGAMYGAMELAERIRLDGAGVIPLAMPIADAPAVPIRGAQLYMVTQEPGEASWWLRDPQFWTEYLDLLAHARIDFLDLRGMFNLANTIFPNALLYFGHSATYPAVGIAQGDRDTNLAMLQSIVRMAASRGIRVGLMTMRSDTSTTGDANDPSVALTDAQLQAYTREAVADIARNVPGLWRMGVRIGESGGTATSAAAWYKASFVAGLSDAGLGTRFYVRTWLVPSKADLLDLLSVAGDDPVVEAKYNGEHLAAPYVIAGGEFADLWEPSYSYQEYLNQPHPYSFVFEARSGGTHRIFRFASYARVARAAQSFGLGSAKGFALEPPSAYFPQRDFYHGDADRYSPWTFRRDELQYMLFGRLAYNPKTPDRVFRAALAARVGTDALWEAMQAASDIVPWIQAANTCGPDARSFAPDEEWGGPIAFWAAPPDAQRPANASAAYSCAGTPTYHGPFDTFAIASPIDAAKDLAAGISTARLTPLEVAGFVLSDAAQARKAAAVAVDPSNLWARDVVRECTALADLGEYFAHKFRGATALAVYEATASADYLAAARTEATAADGAWTQLASDTSYISPFDDNLIVGPGYHWRNVLPWLAQDAQSIDGVVATVTASPPAFQGTLPPSATWLSASRANGPGLAALVVSPQDPTATSWTVAATLQSAAPTGAQATLWYKPFVSHADWQSVPLQGAGTQFQGVVPGTGSGAMFAVQLSGGSAGTWRYPDLLTQTPYIVLAP
jgi:hypothetical protein